VSEAGRQPQDGLRKIQSETLSGGRTESAVPSSPPSGSGMSVSSNGARGSAASQATGRSGRGGGGGSNQNEGAAMQVTSRGRVSPAPDMGAAGRGLHSFPFPLNLSLLCPFPLN
jgi:hypothetical protein